MNLIFPSRTFLSPISIFITSFFLILGVCVESLIYDSEALGFETVGIVKQGEALLSLGLAERLFEIQNELKDDISKALFRREALLRLVDPICLGDFKWFVFSKFKNKKTKIISSCIR